MIRINDTWGIVVDENNYSPVRLDKKPRDKGGKLSYPRIGYYATLQGALGRIAEEMSRDRLKTSDIDLSEAVRIIKECYGELATALVVTRPSSIEVKIG